MTSEIEYKCWNCEHEGSVTHSVPDVPELVIVSHEVFYAPTREWRKTSLPDYYRNNDNLVRDLVDKDQAAEIIAANHASLEQAKKEINTLLVSYVREHFFENKTFQPLDSLIGQISQLDNAITITRDFKNRAEVAEAKLAQIEKPIGYVSKSFFESLKIDRFHSIAAYVLMESSERYSEPLYTAPIVSDADLRAENERLREDLKKLYCGYVNSLENGYDRIKFLGGQCDDVVTMEKNDPVLIAARAALNPPEPDKK